MIGHNGNGLIFEAFWGSHGSQWNVTTSLVLHQISTEPAGRATSTGSDLLHPGAARSASTICPVVGKLCQTIERFTDDASRTEPDWELEVPDCVANSLCWPSICDETADSQPAQQQFTNRFQGEGQESDGSKHPLWWQVFNPDGLLRSATTCYSYICVFVSFSTIFMYNIHIYIYIAIWYALGLP